MPLCDSGTPRRALRQAPAEGLEGAYDALEGYQPGGGGLYDRTLVDIDLDPGGGEGGTLQAWIYHVEDAKVYGEPVPGGDWCLFVDPAHYSRADLTPPGPPRAAGGSRASAS